MDNAYLNGPQGSMLNIGSWFQVDAPPDYGARDLQTQIYNQNAMVDGGQFSYEYAGVRKMSFPLLVASGGAGLSLDSIEAWLRTMARPGAFIDLQPDGVATAEMVRFDVVGGRVNHDAWSIPLQRVDRRKLTVSLDVQPFGYWPTWITLASQFSTLPAEIPINGAASVIGDAPADAEVRIVATQNASWAVGVFGVYIPDSLRWAFSGASVGLIYGPSVLTIGNAGFTGTYVGDSFAPIGSVTQRTTTPALTGSPTFFSEIAEAPSASTPNFPPPGQYRAILWARTGASGLAASGLSPVMFTADVGPQALSNVPLASGGAIATLIPGGWGPGATTTFANASAFIVGSYGPIASMLFQQIDLGPISIPSVAAPLSGGDIALRLWYAASGLGASAVVNIGGLMLVEEPQAGVLTAGLTRRTVPPVVPAGGVLIDSVFRRVAITPGNIASTAQIDNGAQFYRGVYPKIGASTAKIQVLGGVRARDNAGSTSQLTSLFATAGESAFVSVRYRPRFAFLKGL